MSEVIRVVCGQCQTSLKVPVAAAGKRVKCPKCAHSFTALDAPSQSLPAVIDEPLETRPIPREPSSAVVEVRYLPAEPPQPRRQGDYDDDRPQHSYIEHRTRGRFGNGFLTMFGVLTAILVFVMGSVFLACGGCGLMFGGAVQKVQKAHENEAAKRAEAAREEARASQPTKTGRGPDWGLQGLSVLSGPLSPGPRVDPVQPAGSLPAPQKMAPQAARVDGTDQETLAVQAAAPTPEPTQPKPKPAPRSVDPVEPKPAPKPKPKPDLVIDPALAPAHKRPVAVGPTPAAVRKYDGMVEQAAASGLRLDREGFAEQARVTLLSEVTPIRVESRAGGWVYGRYTEGTKEGEFAAVREALTRKP